MPQIKIIKLIGEGSYGKVYECMFDGVHSAIKLLSCSEIGFSPNEVDINKQLSHPNLISMTNIVHSKNSANFFKKYGWDDESVQMGIVLPYADINIREYILSSNWNIKEIKSYIKQIVAGMMHLHYNHYLHLDLKTENIMISNGTVKIIDFGQSQYVPYQTKRKMNVHLITMSYRPPELLSVKDDKPCEYSEKSDVWGLGLVFFEMLTGKDGKFCDFETPSQLKKWITKNINRGWLERQLSGLDQDDIDFYVPLLLEMLEFNPEKRITMDQLCQRFGIPIDSIQRHPSNLVLPKESIDFDLSIRDQIHKVIDRHDISFGTLVLSFELAYQALSHHNVSEPSSQLSIFKGALNMALLMNEKNYLKVANKDASFENVWNLIIISTQCKLRRDRPTSLSQASCEALKASLFNAKDFFNLQLEEGPVQIMNLNFNMD
jgi:serine/threonine protein kinase